MTLIFSLMVAALIYQDHVYVSHLREINMCIEQQVDSYGDICAEADGEEKYDGVVCAVESIKICKGGSFP